MPVSRVRGGISLAGRIGASCEARGPSYEVRASRVGVATWTACRDRGLVRVVGGVCQGATVTTSDREPPRDEPVRLVPHDPAWAARFRDEAELLQATIGSWITGGIHHVGSTAISGLDAKPIIDIAVGVESLEA